MTGSGLTATVPPKRDLVVVSPRYPSPNSGRQRQSGEILPCSRASAPGVKTSCPSWRRVRCRVPAVGVVASIIAGVPFVGAVRTRFRLCGVLLAYCRLPLPFHEVTSLRAAVRFCLRRRRLFPFFCALCEFPASLVRSR